MVGRLVWSYVDTCNPEVHLFVMRIDVHTKGASDLCEYNAQSSQPGE